MMITIQYGRNKEGPRKYGEWIFEFLYSAPYRESSMIWGWKRNIFVILWLGCGWDCGRGLWQRIVAAGLGQVSLDGLEWIGFRIELGLVVTDG